MLCDQELNRSEMMMKRDGHLVLRSTFVVALFAAAAGVAWADTVKPPIYTGDDFSVYPVPNGLGLVEEQVFINAAKVEQNEKLWGSIGTNDGQEEAYWFSTEHGLDGKNGFASIFGLDASGDSTLISDITFGVKDSYFNDVEFSVLAPTNATVAYTLTVTYSDDSTESWATDTSTGLEDMLVLATGATNGKTLFKAVNINSDDGVKIDGAATADGLDQTKQWQVSGVTPVPIPAAAWLFGSALLGMVGIGARRSKAA